MQEQTKAGECFVKQVEQRCVQKTEASSAVMVEVGFLSARNSHTHGVMMVGKTS